MKAQELRIGNLVLLPNGNECKIERNDFQYNSGLSNIEDYQPIPLTKKWLLDFGFKRGVDFWFNGDVILDISPEGLSYRFHYNIILHVHQLQNLYFALTGEELQL